MIRTHSIILIIMLLFFSCTVPQYIWPQKDINAEDINQSALKKKLLIVSRDSEFKNAIVQRIKEAFKDKEVYIKIIGINRLENEDPNDYSATLILNTAMGWRIDKKVESFLKKYGKVRTIIVITTSAGGDILPDLKGRNIDAISTASVIDKTDEVADLVKNKLNSILNEN